MLGAWALAPRGDGYGWWRDVRRLNPTESDYCTIQVQPNSRCCGRVQNYLKRAAVVSLGAYILNLLIFDTYGHFSGGPYDYGRPFVLAIVLLVLGLIALLWIKLRS